MFIDSILESKKSIVIIAFSLLLVLFIGFLDFITGFELSFSIFYVIPVFISSWYADRNSGFFISFISALIWFAAEIISGHVYSHPAILAWNTSVRLAFFVLIAILISKIRVTLLLEQEIADIDELTSLLNRRAFREKTTNILAFCRRINKPVTLAYVDIDNFKAVNDFFGHTEGDDVLRNVGAILRKSLRSTDSVGRMGGDEFALTLPDTDSLQAETVIRKMHNSLLSETNKRNWPVGFSIGVITFNIPPADTDKTIRYVDELMYRVKKSGKNKVFFEVFDAPQPETSDKQNIMFSENP